MQEGNVFILSVCLSVQAKTFENLDIETSFFGMVIHLHHIYVKFECQGHWVKVRVTFVKLTIPIAGYKILFHNQLVILI